MDREKQKRIEPNQYCIESNSKEIRRPRLIDMARSFVSRPGVGDDNVNLQIPDGLSIRRAYSRERGRILARTGWQELSGTSGINRSRSPD